jgi:hypothetical protein
MSGFALAFVSAAFDAVFVLFAYTPIDAGGLAFTVRTGSQKFPDVQLTHHSFPGFSDWLLSIHLWLPFVLHSSVHQSYSSSEVQLCEDVPYLHVLLVFPIRRPSVLEHHTEERKGRVR